MQTNFATRRTLWAAACAGLLGFAVFVGWSALSRPVSPRNLVTLHDPPDSNSGDPVEVEPNIARKVDRKVFFAPIAMTTTNLSSPYSTAREDVELIDTMLFEFRRAMTNNPVAGLNVEVVSALTGANSKRVIFLPPDHPSINSRGELQDRWGTPYFFHALSGRQMEIFSAGPDRNLWTNDDIRYP